MVRRYRRRSNRRSKLRARRIAGGKFILRVPRRGAPMVHRFEEMCKLQTLSVGPTASSTGVLSINLNALLNNGSFKALFDLYKITGVKFKFMYRHNVSDSGEPAGVGSLPVLYTAINRDPFVPAPTSLLDILNDDSCRIHRTDGLKGKGGVYVSCPKPDMSVQIEGGIVTQQWNYGVAKKFQPWLTTGGNGQSLDQSGVNHYGLRWWFDNLQSTQAQEIEVYATLYFAMKEQD